MSKCLQRGASGDAKMVDHFDCPQMRIVLLGKTGVGKSAVGNTILGEKTFNSALSTFSVTHQSEKKRGFVAGRHVAVVDTPGLFDTDIPNEDIQKEIVNCIQLSCPGPHAFLVVMQLNRFTDEEKKSVEALQEIFGEQANKYMIILFTRGDDLQDQTIHDFVQNAHPDLREVIRKCGGRYHVFNNKALTNKRQVEELLDVIEGMIALNGGGFYTQEMYEEAEHKIREMEEMIKKDLMEKKRKRKEALEQERQARAEKVAAELQQAIEVEIERRMCVMREQFEKDLREAREKAEKSDLKLSFLQRLKLKTQKAFKTARK